MDIVTELRMIELGVASMERLSTSDMGRIAQEIEFLQQERNAYRDLAITLQYGDRTDWKNPERHFRLERKLRYG